MIHISPRTSGISALYRPDRHGMSATVPAWWWQCLIRVLQLPGVAIKWHTAAQALLVRETFLSGLGFGFVRHSVGPTRWRGREIDVHDGLLYQRGSEQHYALGLQGRTVKEHQPSQRAKMFLKACHAQTSQTHPTPTKGVWDARLFAKKLPGQPIGSPISQVKFVTELQLP